MPTLGDANALAERFGNLVAERDFANAFTLLATPAQASSSAADIEAAVASMTAYAEGVINMVKVMEVMYAWPAQDPSDFAWVYVALCGDDFSEAVALILCKEGDELRISEMEWGRP